MNYIKKVLVITISVMVLSSCSEYLDVVPDSLVTLDDAFDDESSAESYLYTCYSWMPNLSQPATNPAFFGGDECYKNVGIIRHGSQFGVSFLLQDIAEGQQDSRASLANYWSGYNLYRGIRDCNIFLENIDKVQVIDEGLKKRWVSEAKFLKAYYHFYLFRMYGPIIITDVNVPVDADLSEIHKSRNTVDECVEYIANLFEESAKDLPFQIGDLENELGRVTKSAAFALRAKLLATAASPLFNGNPDYQNFMDKNGVKLFPGFDENKWSIAAEACKVAIDSAEALGAELFKFNVSNLRLPSGVTMDQVPSEIINTLTIQQSLAERWTSEKLFVSTKGNTTRLQQRAMTRTNPLYSNNTAVWGHYSPTLRIAEMFYSKNGVPIEEDITWNYGNRFQLREYNINSDEDFDSNGVPDNQYFVKNGETTINLHFDRETRFYGSLGFDRGIWYGNTNNGTGNSIPDFEDDYLEARGGEYSGDNVGFGKHSHTGYFAKKVTNFDNTIDINNDGRVVIQEYAFPEIRLADLYLLYAECLNEIDDITNAHVYIDKVRERANLKGVVESWANFSSNASKPNTKNGLREIIHQERLIELVFEGHRFWDLKRWKQSESFMTRAFRGWNYEETEPENYYLQPISLFIPTYTFKDYLWPIPNDEILTNPNLVQNPGW